eukprot:2705857-Rhodomonas_salina.1
MCIRNAWLPVIASAVLGNMPLTVASKVTDVHGVCRALQSLAMLPDGSGYEGSLNGLRALLCDLSKWPGGHTETSAEVLDFIAWLLLREGEGEQALRVCARCLRARCAMCGTDVA